MRRYLLTEAGSQFSRRLFVVAALLAVIAFCVTRYHLQVGTTPFLLYDSYKYLGAADSLYAGSGWTPIYMSGKSGNEWVKTTGGVLHVVPGYPWFIDMLWSLFERITIPGVLLAQSGIALLAFAAYSIAIAKRLGRWWGLGTFWILVLSPTIAWIEHSVMPGSLANSCLLLALSLPLLVPPSSNSATTCLSGLAAGLFAGSAALFRGSSQLFLPLPIVVLLLLRPPRNATLAWIGCFTASMLLILSPWIAHNQRIHGVARLTASTGRVMYWSAITSTTLDHRAEKKRLGVGSGPLKGGLPNTMTSLAFQHALENGQTPAEADRTLGRIARHAYLEGMEGKVKLLIFQRMKLVYSLFDLSDRGLTRSHLRTGKILASDLYKRRNRQVTDKNMGQKLSSELNVALDEMRVANKTGRHFVRSWIDLLSFEGLPLFYCFWAALAISLFRPRDWCLTALTAGPPLLFLAAFFALVGESHFRYQFLLHPFMLGAIIAGIARLRLPRNITIHFKNRSE